MQPQLPTHPVLLVVKNGKDEQVEEEESTANADRNTQGQGVRRNRLEGLGRVRSSVRLLRRRLEDYFRLRRRRWSGASVLVSSAQ